jgi:hypothetical protein
MSNCSGIGLVWKAEPRILSLAEAAFDVLVTLDTEPPLPTKLGQPQNRHCDSPVILESSGPPPATLSGLRFGPRENQARGNRVRVGSTTEARPRCKLRCPERRPAASSTPKPACTTSAPDSSTLQVTMHRRRWERSFLAQIPAIFDLQLGHGIAAADEAGVIGSVHYTHAAVTTM